MAFYITSDGRAVSFEAEVKSDGTVRPKKYSEFREEDSNPSNVHASKTTAKKGLHANGDNQRKRVRSINKKKEKERYIEPEPYFAPRVALKMKVEEKRRKKEMLKHEAEIREALEAARLEQERKDQETKALQAKNNQSVSKKGNHLSKTEKKVLLDNIVSIIKDAKLPNNAYNFILTRVSTLTPLIVSDKLERKITGLGLDSYKEKMIGVINRVNSYIRYASHCRNRSFSQQNTNKKIKRTVEIEEKYVEPNDTANVRKLNGNEWISGNYIMKGKQPKYGYARDYFGRVQERDHYVENKDVNPYSSYSDYDAEDDNESLDIL